MSEHEFLASIEFTPLPPQIDGGIPYMEELDNERVRKIIGDTDTVKIPEIAV